MDYCYKIIISSNCESKCISFVMYTRKFVRDISFHKKVVYINMKDNKLLAVPQRLYYDFADIFFKNINTYVTKTFVYLKH